jgi:hypothetical protein
MLKTYLLIFVPSLIVQADSYDLNLEYRALVHDTLSPSLSLSPPHNSLLPLSPSRHFLQAFLPILLTSPPFLQNCSLLISLSCLSLLTPILIFLFSSPPSSHFPHCYPLCAFPFFPFCPLPTPHPPFPFLHNMPLHFISPLSSPSPFFLLFSTPTPFRLPPSFHQHPLSSQPLLSSPFPPLCLGDPASPVITVKTVKQQQPEASQTSFILSVAP